MEIRRPHAIQDVVSDGRLRARAAARALRLSRLFVLTLFNVLTATSLVLLLALEGFLSGPEGRRTPP